MSEQANMAAHYEHEIPEGYEARIEGNKVIIELKESEDERTRKEILAWMKGGNGYEYQENKYKWIAYLEKQKEQKQDSLTKYVYSKENKKFIQDCANILVANDYAASAERLLSMFVQNPVDDKAFEEWIDDWWKHNKVNNLDSYDKGDEIQFDERGFKNFCHRIRNMYQQQPAEWSEEDEKMLNVIIGVLKEIKSQPLKRMEDWDGYIRFLESLRPQPHWKPSEEQITALNCAIQTMRHQLNLGDKRLLSLYNDLKKLM